MNKGEKMADVLGFSAQPVKDHWFQAVPLQSDNQSPPGQRNESLKTKLKNKLRNIEVQPNFDTARNWTISASQGSPYQNIAPQYSPMSPSRLHKEKIAQQLKQTTNKLPIETQEIPDIMKRTAQKVLEQTVTAKRKPKSIVNQLSVQRHIQPIATANMTFKQQLQQCGEQRQKRTLQRLLYDEIFENDKLEIEQLEEAVQAVQTVPVELQLFAGSLLVQHGFYFAAIKALFFRVECLHQVLQEMKLVIVNHLDDNDWVTAAETWIWDSVDRQMFTKYFQQHKIISQFQNVRQQLSDLGYQGVCALSRVEREVLLKVINDFMEQLDPKYGDVALQDVVDVMEQQNQPDHITQYWQNRKEELQQKRRAKEIERKAAVEAAKRAQNIDTRQRPVRMFIKVRGDGATSQQMFQAKYKHGSTQTLLCSSTQTITERASTKSQTINNAKVPQAVQAVSRIREKHATALPSTKSRFNQTNVQTGDMGSQTFAQRQSREYSGIVDVPSHSSKRTSAIQQGIAIQRRSRKSSQLSDKLIYNSEFEGVARQMAESIANAQIAVERAINNFSADGQGSDLPRIQQSVKYELRLLQAANTAEFLTSQLGLEDLGDVFQLLFTQELLCVADQFQIQPTPAQLSSLERSVTLAAIENAKRKQEAKASEDQTSQSNNLRYTFTNISSQDASDSQYNAKSTVSSDLVAAKQQSIKRTPQAHSGTINTVSDEQSNQSYLQQQTKSVYAEALTNQEMQGQPGQVSDTLEYSVQDQSIEEIQHKPMSDNIVISKFSLEDSNQLVGQVLMDMNSAVHNTARGIVLVEELDKLNEQELKSVMQRLVDQPSKCPQSDEDDAAAVDNMISDLLREVNSEKGSGSQEDSYSQNLSSYQGKTTQQPGGPYKLGTLVSIKSDLEAQLTTLIDILKSKLGESAPISEVLTSASRKSEHSLGSSDKNAVDGALYDLLTEIKDQIIQSDSQGGNLVRDGSGRDTSTGIESALSNILEHVGGSLTDSQNFNGRRSDVSSSVAIGNLLDNIVAETVNELDSETLEKYSAHKQNLLEEISLMKNDVARVQEAVRDVSNQEAPTTETGESKQGSSIYENDIVLPLMHACKQIDQQQIKDTLSKEISDVLNLSSLDVQVNIIDRPEGMIAYVSVPPSHQYSLRQQVSNSKGQLYKSESMEKMLLTPGPDNPQQLQGPPRLNSQGSSQQRGYSQAEDVLDYFNKQLQTTMGFKLQQHQTGNLQTNEAKEQSSDGVTKISRDGYKPSNASSSLEPDEQEVIQYAKYLGIDIEEDQELIFIAEWAMTAPVPEGWIANLDSDGNEFFVNLTSGWTQYEHPMDAKYIKYYHELKQKKTNRLTKAMQKQKQ